MNTPAYIGPPAPGWAKLVDEQDARIKVLEKENQRLRSMLWKMIPWANYGVEPS